MSEELFLAIEKRHHFSLPQEYRHMHDRGFFTLNGPSSSSEFASVGNGYLWLNDMEWYSLAEIVAFAFPVYHELLLPNLVPFAFTGSGDYWCWQTDRSGERGPQVLLCPHDDFNATIYAPNFAAALYRQALEYASSDLDDDRALSRKFLHRWSVDLAAVFPAAWCQILEELAKRSPVHWTDRFGEHESFLPANELEHLVKRDLVFPELDMEIPWFK